MYAFAVEGYAAMSELHQQMQSDHNAYYVQPQFSADQAPYPSGFADPSAYYHQHGMAAPAQSSPLTPIATPVSASSVDAGPGRIKWSRIAMLIAGVAIVGVAVVNMVLSMDSRKYFAVGGYRLDRMLLSLGVGGVLIAGLGFYFSIVFKSKRTSAVFYLLSVAIWSNVVVTYLKMV